MTERCVPKGCEITDDGLFVHRDNCEVFLLTNRSFREIDNFQGNILSQLIEHFIVRTTSKPIRILDVGGGRDSQSARDIKERYGGSVNVINIDLVASDVYLWGKVKLIRGDAYNLPFTNESFDLVYSFGFLPHITSADRLSQTISGITNVLKSGGIAILHEVSYTHMISSDKRLAMLVAYLNRNKVDIVVRHPDNLLILSKRPVNTEVITIIRQIGQCLNTRRSSGKDFTYIDLTHSKEALGLS